MRSLGTKKSAQKNKVFDIITDFFASVLEDESPLGTGLYSMGRIFA
jgi:hypothetical protein